MTCDRRIGALIGLTIVGLIDAAGAQSVTRVTVSSEGAQGNNYSFTPRLSRDGRLAVFPSDAFNLVAGDTNSIRDIFVRDRASAQTQRVNISSEGAQAANFTQFITSGSISADGKFAAFGSTASNLVPDDTNNASDVFVRDLQTGVTTRVSVSSAGAQSNASSSSFVCPPHLSADGRFVVFESRASNLVAGDTNNTGDVFVHDRQTGETTRVSVTSAGDQGDRLSDYPSISADGRLVAFRSSARNLVLEDTNNTSDAFVHDRLTGLTSRVSVSSEGQQGNADSANSLSAPMLSADGRFVVFQSNATNLVVDDTNNASDAFVHDRVTAETARVSLGSTGEQANAHSFRPTISADGRLVAFESRATNLVPGDANDSYDIFVRDRQVGRTRLVSVSSAGVQANDDCLEGWISADGTHVGYVSRASNLVPGDTNTFGDGFVRDLRTCAGDANGDGSVGFNDLAIVLTQFGQSGAALQGDIDGDGFVSMVDLNAVLSFFASDC